MHCLDLADALHLRHSLAGDVLSWRRRPLVLTADPELVGGVWVARGTWEGYAVRCEQAVGDELMVWAEKRSFTNPTLRLYTGRLPVPHNVMSIWRE